MTKKKRKTKKKAKVISKKNYSRLYLTICTDCKIRLIVPKDDKCYLCKSTNITSEQWNPR